MTALTLCLAFNMSVPKKAPGPFDATPAEDVPTSFYDLGEEDQLQVV